uniref:Uncharacterized protein n=1 Tax=Oryza brachyantha TaxID=4533 RepID=J3N2P9_ORYBR
MGVFGCLYGGLARTNGVERSRLRRNAQLELRSSARFVPCRRVVAHSSRHRQHHRPVVFDVFSTRFEASNRHMPPPVAGSALSSVAGTASAVLSAAVRR